VLVETARRRDHRRTRVDLSWDAHRPAGHDERVVRRRAGRRRCSRDAGDARRITQVLAGSSQDRGGRPGL